MTENEILLKIQELEGRIEALEKRKTKTGVIMSGTPKYAQNYVENKRKEINNG